MFQIQKDQCLLMTVLRKNDPDFVLKLILSFFCNLSSEEWCIPKDIQEKSYYMVIGPAVKYRALTPPCGQIEI